MLMSQRGLPKGRTAATHLITLMKSCLLELTVAERHGKVRLRKEDEACSKADSASASRPCRQKE